MESIPNQLPAGRDSSCSPNSKDLQSYSGPTLKPNQVSETSLYGIPIVSLVIDGQERLCLAQISNTLLKNYSYNEIHNRRVALGITCVQCTPVQLEILRRAGAMPISSRRCGMITKREAERLCKSFLGAHSPPKLPENFAFDVSHECAWGSRGNFIPARYNSSRAKCIKCSFCNMYFSPNKFIFHSHRTPESKYTQPDAANFNSWRRHLKLSDKNSSDDVIHAWEDVKAMFNGGSRKRTLPIGRSESSSSQPPRGQTQGEPSDVPHKTLRCEDDRVNVTMPSSIRSYPVIPVPSKSFGMLQKIPPPLFPHPYGFPAFGLCQKKDDGEVMGEPNKTNLSGVFWPSPKDSAYTSFPMFWPTTGSLAMPTYHHAQPKPPSDVLCARHNELDVSEQSDRSTSTPKDSLLDNERCSSTQSTRNEEDKSGDESRSIEGIPPTTRKISYISAFRPVVKDVESIAKLYGNRGPYSGPRSGYMSPDFLSESSSYRSVSPDVDSVDDPDVDVESHKAHEDEECLQLSVDDRRSPHSLTLAQSEGVKGQDQENTQMHTLNDLHTTNSSETRPSDMENHGNKHTTRFEVYARERDEHVHQMSTSYFGSATTYQRETSVKDVHEEEPSSTVEEMEPKNHEDENNISEERLKEPNDDEEAIRKDTGSRGSLIEKNIESMAKEELQKQLVEQVELRKKLEREFQNLKDSFQDQMKRELSYREEMVQQLQIVRAHDALHHFSCKMLTPRHCTGTCTFKPPLLPP
ncbi:SKI family transcriptional corepressor 1 homolog-B isoform X2 [Danio aesculapii]|uniref:SKI family transcriptional corepressor 1 homolog-B isoform X2 n=1 Tax=Danio aesculapii TaxID=1142201 RepID=UPI0024BF4198|nr:SKI family transcriptional corepressor 1 homolog-B isoform X2 [Danio aesculapii]